jgi:hypothetical protein
MRGTVWLILVLVLEVTILRYVARQIQKRELERLERDRITSVSDRFRQCLRVMAQG